MTEETVADSADARGGVARPAPPMFEAPPVEPGAPELVRHTRDLETLLSRVRDADPELARAVSRVIARLRVENAQRRTQLRAAEQRIADLEAGSD